MSKIGKKPISIQEDISVTLKGREVMVAGPKGNLSFLVPHGIEVKVLEDKILVSGKEEKSGQGALFGLVRAQLANMVEGVRNGFEKKLELLGVGYRAVLSGNDLLLSVGFSHPVKVEASEGIKFAVSENIITISGLDKRQVGDTAAKIRAIRPPEPYKGKGIRYLGEKVRRKAGKAAKAVGTKQ
ncbi:MAG: 50S ribosomal protein L6 [Candidatus Levybacteria bacterium]|nr:50S ribosomal protein L6 [Candidatus Levybacteria bacterium]MBI2189983.1 50S ribosomal protein L6 [Candidatus Levybacteria bacterium]MBI2622599.1 50S ribosomal protein L6 [Candidatus Levybacteria bacterium]MBI3070261.1 50S ribosomal protein L6 [Candidatus Levybacteria bacterium]MBI3092994.1 50S ribosomal protein L6 [Candidatus Levybacteria bacterium]